ncbi:hypothetical protein D3C72_2504750 [compost metagenome]
MGSFTLLALLGKIAALADGPRFQGIRGVPVAPEGLQRVYVNNRRNSGIADRIRDISPGLSESQKAVAG